MVAVPSDAALASGTEDAPPTLARRIWTPIRRNPTIFAGGLLLTILVSLAILAPWISPDPLKQNTINRLRPPSERFWFGTDQFGRDNFARTLHGARVSLVVGITVAAISAVIGLALGILCGYFRRVDAIVMRIMDGLMAIPGVLLAIALVALSGASMTTVIIAITVPEVPRVVRLVRSVVLTVREEPYVEAAISVGTRLPLILVRHILPNSIPPLIVQATYICASAMLTEAILSFLGAGTPPEIPSWGNMMAEGRLFFPIAPRIVLLPGVALALTILAVNVLGDGLRDRLDPKLAKRM